MICKGNFDGELVDANDGSREFIDGYCVIVCEDENEWGVLREAMHYRLMFIEKNNQPGHPFFDYSDDIEKLKRMYKETE